MPQKILLYYQIAKRAFELVPRRKKTIRLLHLDHQPVEGPQGLILLKYRFSNAIYYSIGGNKLTAQQVIMKRPAEGQEIPFTVFGLFKQNDYVLSAAGNDVVLTRITQKSRPAEIIRNTVPYYTPNLAHS
ncbi:hypothetical protein LRS05_03765 [Flavobacterium sp. J372]|uniref:hypothetical protein n=1 Tax=Flavobacterium sp. J372 TaxID=2898436 RepID=UPI0021511146|nr:hypothetical protein [Flavobacterium sp. J372]MCR5861317.1 hypothetical protein [Flavobacterium sp. J372]